MRQHLAGGSTPTRHLVRSAHAVPPSPPVGGMKTADAVGFWIIIAAAAPDIAALIRATDCAGGAKPALSFLRHARPCAEYPRSSCCDKARTWMGGTSPAMTPFKCAHRCDCRRRPGYRFAHPGFSAR